MTSLSFPNLDLQLKVDPELKRIEGDNKPEKHALRALFDGEIPDPVLWRTKAMQCEGVGLNWVDDLQAFCAAHITDEEFDKATTLYKINSPQSKEEMYYRKIFSVLDLCTACRAAFYFMLTPFSKHPSSNYDVTFRIFIRNFMILVL